MAARVLFIIGLGILQFVTRSDVIKFPANFQNQTKITFIFGVVPIASELLYCLKCFGIFSL